MKQQLSEQQQNKNNQKAYQCKCGKSYDRNSTLFNHIKSQHQNNKEYFLITQSKVGRPQGLKDKTLRCPRGKAIEKRPIKEIQCKCGDILKGEGAFYNHVNGKHKGDSYYKQERKQQGRKKISQHDVSVSDEIDTQIESSLNCNTTEQESQQLNNVQITFNQEQDQFSGEENPLSSTQYRYYENIIDEKKYQDYNNNFLQQDYDCLNIFNNNYIYEPYEPIEESFNLQKNTCFSLQSQSSQEDDEFYQYLQ